MIDLIEKSISEIKDNQMRIHITREFLQLLILKIIYDKDYFKNIAFVGGTALRFLYGLRSFSEDLEFSLIDKTRYKFDTFVEEIIYELEKYGLSVEAKKNTKEPIQSAMIKFKDILYLLGLSKQKEQKLSIRVEIDSNPPKGWKTELSLISKHFVFTVVHFDIPSLYATKIHACFYRKYTKGRDFYDLLWYLGKKIMPNFELLNNAIEQAEKKKINLNAKNFYSFLKEKIENIDFTKVRKDVERFIEDKNELKLLDKNLILKIMSKELINN